MALAARAGVVAVALAARVVAQGGAPVAQLVLERVPIFVLAAQVAKVLVPVVAILVVRVVLGRAKTLVRELVKVVVPVVAVPVKADVPMSVLAVPVAVVPVLMFAQGVPGRAEERAVAYVKIIVSVCAKAQQCYL